MSYEKLTPEKFIENMKSGKYSGVTGARRAIGKAEWKDAEKERVRGIAEKHFGGATSGTAPASSKKPSQPPKSQPKVAAKKTAAAASDNTPKRKGRPPGSGKKAQPTATPRASTGNGNGINLDEIQKRIEVAIAKAHRATGTNELQELRDAIVSVTNGIESLVKAKTAFPDTDFGEMQGSVDLLNELFRQLKVRVSPASAAAPQKPNGVHTESEENRKESSYFGQASSLS
jgi:hypothetical protein